MDFSILKKLNFDSIDLVQLFINGIQVFKAGYKNWVKYSTESDGVTIYNNGLGYKGGTRLSSSGVEKTDNFVTAFGYIPVKGGDTICFCGQNKLGEYVNWNDTTRATNYICVYDASFKFLYAGTCRGDYTLSSFVESISKDGNVSVIKLKNVSSIAYFRMSVFDSYSSTGIDGNTAIITINEEIA